MCLCAYLAHISGDIIPLRPALQSSGIFFTIVTLTKHDLQINFNSIKFNFQFGSNMYSYLSLRAIPDPGKNKIIYGIYLKLVFKKKTSFQGSTQIREVYKSIE
jgi:hypothetical protein